MATTDQGGVWRTINGYHVFIKDGQSASEAIAEQKKLQKEAKTKETENKPKEAITDKPKDPVMQYESEFKLESPVNDFDAAQAYLSDDDMTQYLPDELKEPISSVEWQLDDDETGRVVVKTNRELTEDEAQSLKDWIDGQNSDGLGEGFEQQEFATSYWNPETGEGPFTYREFEQEQERMYDELEPYEYADYLNEDVIEGATENLMEEGGYDVDDPDAWESARQSILDDPEEYLDYEDIAHAKDEYFKDYGGSNEDEWFAMSSMRRNGDDFIETDIRPQAQSEENTFAPSGEDFQDMKDWGYTAWNDEPAPTLKEKYEYLNQKGINELNNFTSDNDDTFIRKEYDKQKIVEDYLNPDNEYTDAWLEQQAEEKGINMDDLDREIGRQIRTGSSYGQTKAAATNATERAQSIIDNDEWHDVTVSQNGTKAVLKDELTGNTVEIDAYDSDNIINSKLNELRPSKTEGVEGYINKVAESQRTEPRNQKEKFVRDLEKKWEDGGSLKDMYEAHKSEAQSLGMSQEEFKDELKGINQAETWGEDWFHEEDKSWGSGNKQSIADTYGLKDKRNEFTVKQYEDNAIDQQEFKEQMKLGGESEETISKIVKANTGENSKNPKVRALFGDNEKSQKLLDEQEGTSKNSISDNLQFAAYQKYLKEHPGSKITFEEFKKSKNK
jgi:hypothetical protein